MLRSVVCVSLLALVGIVGMSCATAGGDDDEMLPPVSADASTQFAPDAGSSVADAMTPDAEPVSIDSGIPGGGFCDGNEDCGAPGECCVIALCTAGTEIGDICLPD